MMKSLQLSKYGDPNKVVKLVESEIPKPKEDEAIVELVASPINPSDIYLIRGIYPRKVEFPFILGNEGLGRVSKIGENVNSVQKGDLVLLGLGNSSWQTHIRVKADQLFPLPDLNKETQLQLAMTSINPPTAYLMLKNFVQLNEGDWIIQNAANSAVGRYVIQLAREMGYKTINVVRRTELIEELKGIGADEVIVDDNNLHTKVAKLIGDEKIRLGLDAVAGQASNHLLKCLSSKATMVVYGALSLEPIKMDMSVLMTRDCTVRSFWLAHWYQQSSMEEIKSVFQYLIKKISMGKLKAKISKTFRLEDYEEALEYADKEAKGGKVLFVNH